MDDYRSPKRSDHETSSSKLQLQAKLHPARQINNQNTMQNVTENINDVLPKAK